MWRVKLLELLPTSWQCLLESIGITITFVCLTLGINHTLVGHFQNFIGINIVLRFSDWAHNLSTNSSCVLVLEFMFFLIFYNFIGNTKPHLCIEWILSIYFIWELWVSLSLQPSRQGTQWSIRLSSLHAFHVDFQALLFPLVSTFFHWPSSSIINFLISRLCALSVQIISKMYSFLNCRLLLL